jgi:hypothetical protein
MLHSRRAYACPQMTPTDILKVALTVIGSLGGGGLIVFGLSGYLGKIWADRALAKQKQDYNQLNIAFTHQLDLATRRVQVELDAIGHLHKLRTESEFEKIRELWRCVASLQAAYYNLPRGGIVLSFVDDSLNKKHRVQASFDFSKRLSDTFEVWSRELLSIPEDIANKADELIIIGRQEELIAIQYPDPYDNAAMAGFSGTTRAHFFDQRNDRLGRFKTKANELLAMMRQQQKGPKTE